jgi:1-acyl-sn-glycerol-3-phosphate acyltransferase
LEVKANSKKPRAEVYRPELTQLPQLTPWRLLFRWIAKILCRLLVIIFLKSKVSGLENIPKKGPALVVINHLGDTDSILGMAFFPLRVDALAKMELYYFRVLGWIMETYGVIWVHRGTADRRALRAALSGLAHGRLIALAPEGRESLSGELEEGTGGAAYLALKAGVPVVPVTFTGTENKRVFGNIKRFRRTRVTMTAGEHFYLDKLNDRRNAIREGTHTIMLSLARQLPEEYRGFYREEVP